MQPTKLFILFILYFLFISCNQKDSISHSNHNISNFIVDNDHYQPLQDQSNLRNVESLYLDMQTNNAVGAIISGFFRLNDGYILYSHYNSYLARVSSNGDLLWVRKPREDPKTSFGEITFARLSKDNSTIEIYDASELTFFYYDLDGRYLKRNSPRLNISDRIPIPNDKYLYDIWPDNNRHATNTEIHYSLALEESDGKISFARAAPRFQDGVHPFNDGYNFFTEEDNIYYQRKYVDTIYQIENDTVYEPYATVSFSASPPINDILNDTKIQDKNRHIREQQIPYIRHIGMLNGHPAGSYQHGPKLAVFVTHPTDPDLRVNATIMKVNDAYIKQPYHYNNGEFMSVLPANHKDLLDELSAKHGDNLDELYAEYDKRKDALDDLTGSYYYFWK